MVQWIQVEFGKILLEGACWDITPHGMSEGCMSPIWHEPKYDDTHTTTTCNNTECWVLSTTMLSTEYWVQQYWVGCREVGTLPTKRRRQYRAPSAWAPSAWAAKDKCDFYIHHLLQSPAMMACDVAIDRSPIIEIQLWKVRDCRGF